MLVLDEGEVRLDGSPAELLRAGGEPPDGDLERALVRFLRSARWLLRKDLLILGRSRLLLVLLIVYPVVIAVLIGVALSRGPSRARVAIVDETPPGEVIHLGGQKLEVDRYANELLSQADTVKASSRDDAVAKVKSGDVTAAIVIPRTWPPAWPRAPSGRRWK